MTYPEIKAEIRKKLRGKTAADIKAELRLWLRAKVKRSRPERRKTGMRERLADIKAEARDFYAFVRSKPILRRRRWVSAFPTWLRLTEFTLMCIALGCLLACFAESLRLNESAVSFFVTRTDAFDLTALLIAALLLTLSLMTGRLGFAFPLAALPLYVFSCANYCKCVVNGSPISLEDLRLLERLGEVTELAGELPLPSLLLPLLLLTLLITVLLLLLSPPLLRGEGRLRYKLLLLMLCFFTFGVFGSGSTALGQRFSVDMENRQSAENSYEAYGALAGIYRDAAVDRQFYIPAYSEGYMRAVLQRIDERLAEAESKAPALQETPNVILLLEEAQFDIAKLPRCLYSADPTESYHALSAESRTGRFFSRYLGFGTGYIEMGVLSGLQGRYFAAGTNICFLGAEGYRCFDSLPRSFQNAGYVTCSYHSHNNSLYQRPQNFAALGFSETLFQEDIGPYTAHGAYIADEYLLGVMAERMKKENEAGNKVFLYGITMENHQPYTATKFTEPSGVTVSSPALTGEETKLLQCLTDGTVYADRALGQLVETLKAQDEPVLLVAYGDHRPNLSLGETENVYSSLGLAADTDMSRLSLPELQELYTTNYLMWSNVPALQKLLADTERDESYGSLGAELLRLAGLPMSRYWRLLSLCRSVALVDSDRYFADAQGNVFARQSEAGLSDDDTELLQLLRAVIYDAYYGRGYITAEMNEVL